MNWDECDQKGEVLWDTGAPAPAMKQYLARHAVRVVLRLVLTAEALACWHTIRQRCGALAVAT
jgi:hypothetical protein